MIDPRDTEQEYAMRRKNLIEETLINIKSLRSEPRVNTQGNNIVRYLEKGHTLTAIEALDRFGTLKLSTRIGELKQAGYKINGAMVIGGKKRFMRYWMEV